MEGSAMQGILGVIILAIFIAFMEFRSRKNGHAQHRAELQVQIARAKDLHHLSILCQKSAEELNTMIAERDKTRVLYKDFGSTINQTQV